MRKANFWTPNLTELFFISHQNLFLYLLKEIFAFLSFRRKRRPRADRTNKRKGNYNRCSQICFVGLYWSVIHESWAEFSVLYKPSGSLELGLSLTFSSVVDWKIVSSFSGKSRTQLRSSNGRIGIGNGLTDRSEKDWKGGAER